MNECVEQGCQYTFVLLLSKARLTLLYPHPPADSVLEWRRARVCPQPDTVLKAGFMILRVLVMLEVLSIEQEDPLQTVPTTCAERQEH